MIANVNRNYNVTENMKICYKCISVIFDIQLQLLQGDTIRKTTLENNFIIPSKNFFIGENLKEWATKEIIKFIILLKH